MSMGGTGKFGYSTRDPLSRYLDPPGRPDSFISLSQSGKNFLTSDKYLDGAKRRHFPEPPQGIAIADVNYGIYKQPPPAPKTSDGTFVYDKEELVLPGALVAPCSWRPVGKPELNNPFMMTPTQRRILLKQQKAANEARVYNQSRTREVVRREYIMRNSYPHGVMGIDAPVPGSKVYADKAAEIARISTKSRSHAALRRESAMPFDPFSLGPRPPLPAPCSALPATARLCPPARSSAALGARVRAPCGLPACCVSCRCHSHARCLSILRRHREQAALCRLRLHCSWSHAEPGGARIAAHVGAEHTCGILHCGALCIENKFITVHCTAGACLVTSG